MSCAGPRARPRCSCVDPPPRRRRRSSPRCERVARRARRVPRARRPPARVFARHLSPSARAGARVEPAADTREPRGVGGGARERARGGARLLRLMPEERDGAKAADVGSLDGAGVGSRARARGTTLAALDVALAPRGPPRGRRAAAAELGGARRYSARADRHARGGSYDGLGGLAARAPSGGLGARQPSGSSLAASGGRRASLRRVVSWSTTTWRARPTGGAPTTARRALVGALRARGPPRAAAGLAPGAAADGGGDGDARAAAAAACPEAAAPRRADDDERCARRPRRRRSGVRAKLSRLSLSLALAGATTTRPSARCSTTRARCSRGARWTRASARSAPRAVVERAPAGASASSRARAARRLARRRRARRRPLGGGLARLARGGASPPPPPSRSNVRVPGALVGSGSRRPPPRATG